MEREYAFFIRIQNSLNRRLPFVSLDPFLLDDFHLLLRLLGRFLFSLVVGFLFLKHNHVTSSHETINRALRGHHGAFAYVSGLPAPTGVEVL